MYMSHGHLYMEKSFITKSIYIKTVIDLMDLSQKRVERKKLSYEK